MSTELEQVEAILDPICRRQVLGSDPMGQCCPECRHTDFVHPGRPNPSLDSCAVCMIIAAGKRIDAFIEEQRRV